MNCSDLKIVAGMGCIDDYTDYVRAGADEIFIGYVPYEYAKTFGDEYPLNRREVKYVNVQIGSESELLILRDMADEKQVPVSIVINGLFYSPDAREYIHAMVVKLVSLGFKKYIIAEFELIRRLSDIEGIELTVSGELCQVNSLLADAFKNMPVKRIILPRQTDIRDVPSIADAFNIELEAFVLNEKCHFTGAYCNSVHCDELCHMCRVPYRLNGNEESCGLYTEFSSGPGATGCGICSMYKMRESGITHLKIVSRGNSSENTIEDIKLINKALKLLEESTSEAEYISKVNSILFPEGCGHNCYGGDYFL